MSLFFELPPENEPQTQGASMDYTPSEFVEFIIRRLGLEWAEGIGRAVDAREICAMD
jgi:hypothetical protein